MKKIFKYIFAGMAAMSVVACSEDALETSPSSSVSGNELLGTATNALVSLNGVYRAMYTAGFQTALTLINVSVSQLIIWWQMLWVKIAL